MSYDAPGVPLDFSGWMHDFPEREQLWGPLAFDFGLLAAVPLHSIIRERRWVLVFECGCTRVIDRAGKFYEYLRVWAHGHFVDR